MGRWIRFLFVIAIGFGIGVGYAWVIDPPDFVDATPDSLRSDYQADYVLMVAEIYHSQGDLTNAIGRLTFLGEQHPADIIRDAIETASQIGYSKEDMSLLSVLNDAIIAENPVPGGLQP